MQESSGSRNAFDVVHRCTSVLDPGNGALAFCNNRHVLHVDSPQVINILQVMLF
jgi:hypothetical protein